jgi:outer membrane receptor protein involved in Fe transport
MRRTKVRSVGNRIRVLPTRPFPSPTRLSLAIAATLSGAATVHPTPVLAADASAETSTLEEVVVTARKRTENLQDVPISIDVYTSKDLQERAISQFEDYATITPSISFVSAGPGTQTFVMRGVSDGSNPNYSNTATTAFLVDDMSMNFGGVTPDLHLYDIERIEVLNGPQGTTFGASAMAGALRFITNKPDSSGFSAGADLDGGKIDGGTKNGTVEGFMNIPLIPDWTALRFSAYRDYHGGYIDNINTTREWVNGTVSNNSQWAGQNYNVERVTGGRLALGQKIADGWKATLTASYQKQLTHGAWDENLSIGGAIGGATSNYGQLIDGPVRSFGQKNVDRFGPEFKQFYAKTLDFHLEGDVGIGDLVYANTYWAQDDTWVNEYSEYMQYVHTGPPNNYTAANRQSFTCLNGPTLLAPNTPLSGCNVPIQYYNYTNKSYRWSNELRLQSKEDGGWAHWLVGAYWERTRSDTSELYSIPGLQPSGAGFQQPGNPYAYYASYYGITKPSRPGAWYTDMSRYDYLQMTEFLNVTFDLTKRLKLEIGTVHFESHFNDLSYGGNFSYAPALASQGPGGSEKWDSKGGLSYKATDDLLVYIDAAQGFRDGGVNNGLPSLCAKNGVPATYKPDTLTNYEVGWKSSFLDKHLQWNGAVYLMPWKNYQSLLFDPNVCASASFDANIGNAKIYGSETEIKYAPNSRLSMDVSLSYNDSRMITDIYYTGAGGANAGFDVRPGERLPYVPYFDWSGNVRYEAPVKDELHWYAQYDVAHKGDMFNSLQASGTNGLPYVLQPGYSIMNVRFGLTRADQGWTTELYVTNLTDKNAVIYTNEGNFDLRQTVNEPRVFGARLIYRFGKNQAFNNED